MIRTFKIGVACVMVSASALAQEVPKVLAIGSPAPDFSLPGIDGKTHTLADFSAAKVLCLIFTCNHCPGSVGAAPRMEQIHQDYKDKGVALVAVNPNHPDSLRPDELGYSPFGDSFEEMAPFAADYKWTFPYLYDGEKQELATACGAQSTPHVFLFDGKRKLVYTGRMDDGDRNPGPVEKSHLRDALDAVLAGKPVAEPVTRSFGCSTKWLFKKGSVAADQAAWEKKPVKVADLDAALAAKIRANGGGNVRLINFWSTACSPCVEEFPDLVDTYRRFQNRRFDFITISLDPADQRDAVAKFLQSRHAALSDRSVPALRKEGRDCNNFHWTGGNPDHLAEAIDPDWTGALPHSVILAPGGEVLWRHTGGIDVIELRRQIIAALNRQ
ncbi:MAG: redoxin domain-containing protein [Akkermansiaceae bacterium]|jgi:peroxiredoxin|nr:redoxin domain-containing protein [Akkermansiaceae bacterium]